MADKRAVGDAAQPNQLVRVATLNVNGIRAAARRGLEQWLTDVECDVVLLQEVRASEDIVRDLLPDWELVVEPSQLKGRAGVAIASRLPIIASRHGLGQIEAELVKDQPVHTGRWVEADLKLPFSSPVQSQAAAALSSAETATPPTLTVASAYLHSATNSPGFEHTMAAKFAHLAAVTARLRELIDHPMPALVAGDLNIAHQNIDVKNWKGNLNTAGFTPAERQWLTDCFDDLGWLDVGRHLEGDKPGPYSWWSWRGQAFNNDAGWRLDYQLVNRALAPLVRSHKVHRADDYSQRISDHAPVVVEYAFS